MSPPVPCLRQEWHVVCQRARKVHLLLLWGTLVLGLAFLGAFWLLLGVLYICGLLVFLASYYVQNLVILGCLELGTSFGRCLVGALPLQPPGEYLVAHKIACQLLKLFQVYGNFMHHKSYMLALAGRPSLHGHDACMIYWAKGALRRNRRQKYCKTSFSPF